MEFLQWYMYQMYAYAKKYEENGIIPEIYVIYPKTKDMIETKYFESNDGVKVNIFFIDLVNIEKSLEELKKYDWIKKGNVPAFPFLHSDF